MANDDRSDWDIILRHLQTVAHDDAVIEMNGKRWFYTQPEHVNHGIFMLPQRAPENTPVIDGEALVNAEMERAA